MHGNHGNCRLPGNLPGNHISPHEVVVQLKMDIRSWLKLMWYAYCEYAVGL
jgi:hypothetical protein